MKYHEIVAQPQEELQTTLRERRRHLDQLRFKVADDTSKNVRELRTVRKEIAQIMTALNTKVATAPSAVSAPAKAVAAPKAAVKKTAAAGTSIPAKK